MPIEFRCGQCSQLLRVPDDSAGKQARCPRCQALMPVPLGDRRAPDNLSRSPTETAAPSPAPLEEVPFAAAESPEPPPPQPANENPFGEAIGENPFLRPAAGSLNPYASPATFASYHPATNAAGQRLGLPWDNGPRTLGCWFRTVRVILGSPNEAFAIMHQTGGLGQPIHYSIYGVGMPLSLLMVLAIPIIVIAVSLDPPAGLGRFEIIGIGFGITIGVILYVFAVSTIGNFIGAAFWHLFLMLVGGAKAPYETTFRVTSYVNGSLMWLSFIPYIGGCAAGVWTLVLLIVGLAKAHDIPTSKAVLAVLIPLTICGIGYFTLIALFLGGPFLLERLGLGQ